MSASKLNLRNSSFMTGFGEPMLADFARVLPAWTHVEDSFRLLLLSLVVMEGQSGRMSTRPKYKLMAGRMNDQVQAIKARFKELKVHASRQQRIVHIVDRVASLRKERDELVHGLWAPSFAIKEMAGSKCRATRSKSRLRAGKRSALGKQR